MEGQLWNKSLSARIETECVHCRRPMRLEIRSELTVGSVEPGAAPLVYVPMVDFAKLDDPSIIDAF